MIRRQTVGLVTGTVAWRGIAVLAAVIVVFAQLTLPVRVPVSDPIAAIARPVASWPVGDVRRPALLYPAIAEHPLFSPTREAYVAPKAPVPTTAAEHSALRDYLLLGTVVEGDTGIAILKPPSGHETIRAMPGQTIAGWKLREITPDGLKFENGAAKFALHFPTPRWPHE